jgi:hypothetical protein
MSVSACSQVASTTALRDQAGLASINKVESFKKPQDAHPDRLAVVPSTDGL